jgi:hypothetical protein
LVAVLVKREASASPIMEAIQAVAEQSFGGSQTREATEKKLIIVSDMLQYTDGYKQYGGIRPDEFERFSKTEYSRRVRADLKSADVEIFYVQRATKNAVQGTAHYLFWEKFIRNSGGRLDHIAPVAG